MCQQEKNYLYESRQRTKRRVTKQNKTQTKG